ncbi:MAG: GNAT family N-acetyltransferase [Pseudomonadota bacterium]
MDRQPTLQSERVLLRPMRQEDRDALFAIASNPAVWEQHPIHDRWREEVFADFFADAMANTGALVVIDRAKDTVVGSSQFRVYEDADGAYPEIGWTFFSTTVWGKGINPEVKRLMLAHAFQFYDRVQFKVGETNYRSRIAVERLGAVRSRKTDLSQYQGKRVLHLIYVLSAEAFATGPLGAPSGAE